MQVDLGLNRPLGYYTGLVFELYADEEGSAIGGGGRYDGLVRALGGGDVATLGFAFELERLQAVLADAQTAASGPSVLVAAASDADFPAAVSEAERRRAEGVAVELEVNSRTADQRQLYCRARHIRTLVVVGSDGVSETAVVLEPQYA